MRDRGFLLLVVLVVASMSAGAGRCARSGTRSLQEAEQASTNKEAQTQGIKIPDGTGVDVALKAPFSSQQAKEGDTVEFNVAEAVVVNGVTVIEKGAKATARVGLLKPAGHGDREAMVGWVMQDVVAVDGSRVPLRFRKEPRPPSKEKNKLKEEALGFGLNVVTGGWTFFPVTLPIVAVEKGVRKGRAITFDEGERFLVFTDGEAKVAEAGSEKPDPPL